MRTDLALSHLSVRPGQTARIDIDVTNTDDVIDGITAIVDGIDPTWVELDRPMLHLFPETSQPIGVLLKIPEHCPAGVYLVVIRLASVVDPERTRVHDLWLTVEPRVAFELDLVPSIVTGGSEARIGATVHNAGNTDAQVTLSAIEATRHVDITVEPRDLRLRYGASARTELHLRARRPWFGPTVPHTLTVIARSGDTETRELATFNQKPRIPRGVITALILASIVALWAVILLLILTEFNRTTDLPKRTSSDMLTGSDDIPLANIEGSLQGRVTSVITAEGLPRITVTAYRFVAEQPTEPVVERTGSLDARAERLGPRRQSLRPVASAATQDDGSFTIAPLIPGTYKLLASAVGFEDQWFETEITSDQNRVANKLDGATGEVLDDSADALTDEQLIATLFDDNLFPGEEPGPERLAELRAATEATALRVLPNPSDGDEAPAQSRFVASIGVNGQLGGFSGRVALPLDPDGNPVPASSVGLAATATIVGADDGAGGDAEGDDAVVTVSDDDNEGATTAATAPTIGAPQPGDVADDGIVTFENLPTPATYSVTVTGQNFETARFEQELNGGETSVFNTVRLQASVASIRGLVVDESGNGLGDVVVTARSGGVVVSVTTPTVAEAVGRYEMIGLPSAETYVITFQRDGYSGATQAVRLPAGGEPGGTVVNATLTGGLGTVTGRTVEIDPTGLLRPLGGVVVSVSNEDFSTQTSTLTSVTPGAFSVGNLPVDASYVLTFSGDGLQSETRTVAIPQNGGAPSVGDVVMSTSTSRISGTVTAPTGGGLANVTVTLCDGVRPRTTTSASSPIGVFTFEDVATGSYTVTAVAPIGSPDLPTAVIPIQVAGGIDGSVVVQFERPATPPDPLATTPARCGPPQGAA